MRVDVTSDDCWSPAAIAFSVEVELLSLDTDVAALQSQQRNDRSKSGNLCHISGEKCDYK